MGIALAIVSILFVGALALNFLLLRVLKNTFSKLEAAQDYVLTKDCLENEKSYDGKYYPGAVISTLKYDCESDLIATDFSRYDDLGVIGITCCCSDKYPAKEFERLGLSRDEVERPQYIPNVIVYSPREGFWKWKSQDGLS